MVETVKKRKKLNVFMSIYVLISNMSNRGEKASTTIASMSNMSLFQTCNQGEKASTEIAFMSKHVLVSNFEMQPVREGLKQIVFLSQAMSLFQTLRCNKWETAVLRTFPTTAPAYVQIYPVSHPQRIRVSFGISVSRFSP